MTSKPRVVVRFVVWALGLCDADGDPSAPKMAAFAVIGMALYIALRSLQFGGWDAAVLSLAMAALFGRSVFLHFLNRNTWSRAETATEQVTKDYAAMMNALPNVFRDNESGDPPK